VNGASIVYASIGGQEITFNKSTSITDRGWAQIIGAYSGGRISASRGRIRGTRGSTSTRLDSSIKQLLYFSMADLEPVRRGARRGRDNAWVRLPLGQDISVSQPRADTSLPSSCPVCRPRARPSYC
jgi:hypothetical protein